VILDPSTKAGARALERLGSELVCWLTTVSPAGQPQSMPVWFLWSDGDVVVYSLNTALRIRNIEANPKVSVHLADDGVGGDLVILEGTATIDPDLPPIPENAAYVAKYAKLLADYGWTGESMAAQYDTRLRIRPTRARALGA
jgi:PPOX class probable F420-dependent enzyme